MGQLQTVCKRSELKGWWCITELSWMGLWVPVVGHRNENPLFFQYCELRPVVKGSLTSSQLRSVQWEVGK